MTKPSIELLSPVQKHCRRGVPMKRCSDNMRSVTMKCKRAAAGGVL